MPTKSNASILQTRSRSLTALAALLGALAFLAATCVTATAQASPLTYWDQPALVNPTTITVSDTSRTLNLPPFQELADVGPGQVGQLPDFTVQNTYDCDPTNPRTIDGTSDGGVAWASVRGCPTPRAGKFVQATSSGATGPDESSAPATADPNEFVDPLRYQATIGADNPLLYVGLGNTSATAAVAQPSVATAT